jgi:hypothetical protein
MALPFELGVINVFDERVTANLVQFLNDIFMGVPLIELAV